MKRCTKCLKEKPLSEFYHGGRDSACKACSNKMSFAWAKANPKKKRRYVRRSRIRRRGKARIEKRRYRQRHPEQARASVRKSYLKRREYYMAYNAAYNKERCDAMHESYVRQLAAHETGLRSWEIPAQYVAIKTKLLKLKRYAKNV